MKITINSANANRRIGHDGICKKVGDHTPDELVKLALHARKSGNPLLISCFTDLPTLEELTGEKVDAAIEEVKTKGKRGKAGDVTPTVEPAPAEPSPEETSTTDTTTQTTTPTE